MTSPSAITSKSPYTHQALKSDEIRLLTITWTTLDEFELRTECHLMTADLEYDAISYVWGTAPASVSVKCNDGMLSITENAYEMLGYLYLFKPAPQRPIWVDAICINQADADEKAVQVPLMHRVYSSAQCVLVWPGHLDQKAILCASELQKIPVPWDLEATNEELRQQWPIGFSYQSVFWQGLAQLINLEWFDRLWTFQESVLARSLVFFCGQACLDFDQLMRFIVNVVDDPTHPFGKGGSIKYRVVQECHLISTSRDMGRTSARVLPMLLQYLRRRQSGEEIDRIWAIFGLFDPELQKDLAPFIDYTDIARREHWRTLISCMKQIALESQYPSILHTPRAALTRPSYLPSWCPDFRGRGTLGTLLECFWSTRGRSYRTMFRSSDMAQLMQVHSHRRRLISVSKEDNCMSFQGFEVDTIAEIVEDEQLVGAWGYKEDYSSSRENFKRTNPTHFAAVKWLEKGMALARSVIWCGEQVDDSLIPDEFFMAFWVSEQVTDVGISAYLDASKALIKFDHSMREFTDRQRKMWAYDAISHFKSLVGHTWVSTHGGRFGIASPGCKPGDKVCVFYGGEPLYVIRPRPYTDPQHLTSKESVKVWEFAGVAYIPHLMDQHTIDDSRQGPVQMFALI